MHSSSDNSLGFFSRFEAVRVRRRILPVEKNLYVQVLCDEEVESKNDFHQRRRSTQQVNPLLGHHLSFTSERRSQERVGVGHDRSV
jgi:hypothetical protein